MPDVQQIAHDLLGTCGLLQGVLNAHGIDDLTVSEHEEMDALVFECNGCGWWCGPEEQNDEPTGNGFLCGDCNNGDDDDA